MSTSHRLWFVTAGIACSVLFSASLAAERPKSPDADIRVELFAEHPELVTPTGLAVDRRGRVFVAESHTHFRPDDYDGPTSDRILIFEDTDGDGRADRRSVFHEGFTHVMDIEFHYDGSLYVATRMDIHRLRDTDGDDRADDIQRIVFLETKGNYPHNGLSGIAFDRSGGFHFGLGENLGEPYRLVGADDVSFSGGGEGGSTYWCDALGRDLRRVSTGWWNPYGMCTDSFGRVFGTDNDPDASPPCRLIQVVEGGDYGYEFRYGRSGRNPLVAWNGEVPGTLPMIAGTGEAPCHIVAYESDGLPAKYFGSLLVPSWADHRVEYFALEQRFDQGLVTTQRQVLVQGPDDFRPVGIDVAPDGSVYVSDWVSSSYTLHKQGRIWRIRPAKDSRAVRAVEPHLAARSHDRRVREDAMRQLDDEGKMKQLAELALSDATPQARATAAPYLDLDDEDSALALWAITRDEGPVALRAAAAKALFRGGRNALLAGRFVSDQELPIAVRVEAVAASTSLSDANLGLFRARDPLLRHAARMSLARMIVAGSLDADLAAQIPPIDLLLASKRAVAQGAQRPDNLIAQFLSSADPEVRFAAIKWVSDEKLDEYRPRLEELLQDPHLDLTSFLAIQVALLRLEGKPTADRPPAERLADQIFSANAPPAIRRISLRLVDPAHPALPLERLVEILGESDPSIRLEAVRTLGEHPDSKRRETLIALAKDRSEPDDLRAAAILGLGRVTNAAQELVELAADPSPIVQQEALRNLVGETLSDEQRSRLEKLVKGQDTADLVARVLNKKSPTKPSAENLDQWLELLPKQGDPLRGERIFFGARTGTCSKCHQADGRGAAVGPDLSRINARVAQSGGDGRRWLLETILQPSREMGPQYTPWTIVTKDGKQLTGLPRRKGGNSEAYLGSDGKEFTLKTDEIDFHRESDVSIMPADLLQPLTLQEVADLLAYLSGEDG